MAETKRQRYEVLRSQLESERSSFLSHWRDLGDFVFPRRPRFTVSDANKGDRRNQKIVDSTATLAARTLRSGMMGGVTSPARPWFRLTTPDPALAEFGPVKEWLHVVSQRMSTTFLRSNLYNVLPIIYGDIGTFATGAMSIEEDMDDVLRCYPFPIGSYMIANNDKLKVDVFFREFRMTVRQLIQRFGQMTPSGKVDWSNFSIHVKNMWDRGEYETWIDVCHLIQPNIAYDERKMEAKYKRYLSCYYEKGYVGSGAAYMTGADQDRFLRESGYDYFPILCPRWEVTGEDVYGTDCPGMTALGDIKQLQVGERRIAQAIEKMVNPPMTGPTSLRNQKATILPGDITYLDSREGQQGFRPAHEINPRIGEMENKQQQVRDRIRRVYFEDLFLMLANDTRSNITAREIEERHEEKLLALGPVLEQLNQDLLDPLIDNAFNIMLTQSMDAHGGFGGMIPQPPEELAGVKLKVEYTSVMAQAQKLVGIGGLERLAQFGGQVAQFDPRAAKKIKWDQMVDEYSESLGTSPRVIRTDEEVEEMMAAEAQAHQAQVKAEMMKDAAGAAKDLSQADMTQDSALTRLIQQGQAGNLVPAQ